MYLSWNPEAWVQLLLCLPAAGLVLFLSSPENNISTTVLIVHTSLEPWGVCYDWPVIQGFQ